MSKNETHICTVDGCNIKHNSKGYCRHHYNIFRRHGNPNWTLTDRRNSTCLMEGCKGDYFAKGFCRIHYKEVVMPLYMTWTGMMARCYKVNNPNYKNYGGRGISVSKRWHNYTNFKNDMTPRPSPEHSLDRIDNDGDYSPENCRWATKSQQIRNRRISRNNKSGKIGVSYERKYNRWQAYIYDGRRVTIGRFKSKEKAIEARLLKEKELSYYKK